MITESMGVVSYPCYVDKHLIQQCKMKCVHVCVEIYMYMYCVMS